MGSQKKNNNSSSSIDSPLSYFFYTTYMYVRYYYKSKMCIDASKLNLFQPLMISVQDDFKMILYLNACCIDAKECIRVSTALYAHVKNISCELPVLGIP